ncbi:MAG: OmpA family protein [Bacteroidota bacterium]|nr:OmpA family protein [Bacteroidota bacterium]
MKTLKSITTSAFVLVSMIGISQTTTKAPIASSKSGTENQWSKGYPTLIYSNSTVTPTQLDTGIIKLPNAVNGDSPEMGPIISPDGQTLYFSRYKDAGNVGGKEDEEDIWFAEWDAENNTWGKAKNMGEPLNNKYPNFINSISLDGKTITLGNVYLPNGKMNPGVSLSRRNATGWSTPEEMVIDGSNKIFNWSGFYLSNDEKVLLMTNEQRKHSFGDLDLWASFKKADNTWAKPINLGPTINTKGKELAPFLADDGRTLFYSSDGIPGYGSCDIFVSRRLDDSWTNWSIPENLGPRINTVNYESFFSVSSSGNDAYFTSQIGESGNFDMYTINLLKTNLILDAAAIPIVITPKAIPASVDLTPVAIKPVYFGSNKSSVTKEYFAELDRLAKLLENSPQLKLEVSGYADNIGTIAYNDVLSRKRAEAVVAYIKTKASINKDRFVVSCFGEVGPLADNTTEEGRSLNRTVKFNVIDTTPKLLTGANR